MSRNESLKGTQFSTTLDENLELLVNRFFISIGAISTIISIITFYLLIRRSEFFSAEIRALFLLVQVSAFLNNFHYCILFAPILYPFTGGGYCNGVLCMLGVRFHYGMCFWLWFIVLLCASFVILMFAKHQTLLQPWSKLRLRTPAKTAFYIYTLVSLHLIPVMFIFSDTPLDIQESIVEMFGFDWIAKRRVYAVVNGLGRPVYTAIITYTILGNLIVFGSITVLLFLMLFRLITTANVNQMSNQARSVYRAKIKNGVVVLVQMVCSICISVIPLCVMIATVGIGVGADIEKIVIISELCNSFMSPVNSLIFIFGNKQYVAMLRETLRRPSKFARSRSISEGGRRMSVMWK